jgi:hypothetical protein
VVKVYYRPGELTVGLAELGWSAEIRETSADGQAAGDRLAQAGHPLKPRTIQTAIGELEAAGLAAGSQEGNGTKEGTSSRAQRSTTSTRRPLWDAVGVVEVTVALSVPWLESR